MIVGKIFIGKKHITTVYKINSYHGVGNHVITMV